MGTPADDTGQYPVPERKDMPAAAWSLAPPTFVDVAGLSHVGRVRDKNEDHFLIARFGRALEVLQSNLPEGRVPPRAEEAGFVLFVADGLGGGAAGEVASELAILTSLRLLLQRPDWILRLDR